MSRPQFALSRRAALQGLGGLVIGLYLPGAAPSHRGAAS